MSSSCAQKGLDTFKRCSTDEVLQHSQIKSDTALKASHPLPELPRASEGPVKASAVSVGFAELTTAVSLLQDHPHCLPREADEQRRPTSLLCFRRGQDQEVQQEPLQGIKVLCPGMKFQLGMWLRKFLLGCK